MAYTIEFTFPPNIEDIRKELQPSDTAIYTYGDTIYCPKGNGLSTDLLDHELTHVKQQGKDPKKWWKQYLSDPEFRLKQEVEAYRVQLASAKNLYPRHTVRKLVRSWATTLSSPMYKIGIDKHQARKMIEG